MNNLYYKRLWLITRIWLTAVVTNTILGTLCITTGFVSFQMQLVWEYLALGISWGSIFSAPIMVALLVILKNCIRSGMTGGSLFRTMLISGIGLTVLMFLIFWVMLGGYSSVIIVVLLGIAVLSAIVAITSHYRSLLKWGSDFNNNQKVLS
jgi:hypothetical protein